jgi:iron complex transport system permease protein
MYNLAAVTRDYRYFLTLSICLALLIIVFIIDLGIGSTSIPFGRIVSVLMGTETDSTLKTIVLDIRLPKALTALLAGAGLSMGGLLTQTLFRNPLAGPDVLGLSAGSSLAVAMVILGGFSGAWSVVGAATLGASAVFLIVIAVSQRISNNASLLIVGLMIGALASSIVGILQYLSRAEDLQKFTLWTMGNISSTNKSELWIMLLLIIIGVIISITSTRSLNAWVLGEHYNLAMGLSTSSFRWKVLLATCLITGSITAFCGPITFVGIAVPHFVKRIFPTNNHHHLIPLTVIVGGILLLLCDLLTLLPPGGTILPINAATALFGAPVIIWIVIRSKKEFY